jgi:hypothetical protein
VLSLLLVVAHAMPNPIDERSYRVEEIDLGEDGNPLAQQDSVSEKSFTFNICQAHSTNQPIKPI